MKTILFQGDSITDANRTREEGHMSSLGGGYASHVAGRLGVKYPNEYKFYNRGISGNRVVDLYARMKADIINLKPDYMSVMIGINDFWHELDFQNGVAADKYEKIYTMLLEETLAELPDIKIFLLLPFVCEGSATGKYLEELRQGTYERAAAAKRVAEKLGLPYIDLQALFDDALKKAPASYWLLDGVHPDAPGAGLIADTWIDMFEKIK